MIQLLPKKTQRTISLGITGVQLATGFLILLASCAALADLLPLPYGPEYLDLEAIYQPPFSEGTSSSSEPVHWLGTDRLGRDVVSNLIYGCRTALLVSLPAMALATLLGIVLGGIAGYYGNTGLAVNPARLFTLPVAFILAFFYAFYLRQFTIAEALKENFSSGFAAMGFSLLLFAGILYAGYWLARFIRKPLGIQHNLPLPLDQIVLKSIELVSSIPRLILILFLTAYVRPSLLNIVLIAGLTYWTEPARLIRAEILRIKASHYIESAKALGLHDVYILIRHALPNALSSVIVACTFGIIGLISLEATLSFLNIGVPPDTASWGRLVAGAKSNLSAWWLVVFPGITLCLTVLSLHTCSSYLIRQLNPHRRRS